MDTLHKALQESIQGASKQFLEELIDQKSRAQGVRLTRSQRVQLAERILEGAKDGEILEAGGISKRRQTLSLEFTDEDSQWMEEKFREFEKELPEMYVALSTKLSKGILRTLKRSWRDEHARQLRDQNGFRRRLHRRWGCGVDKLRMLITIAREYGADVNAIVRTATHGAPPKSFEVLIRLQARSCQVADEVVCLLEGGFADGAMARWRTLQEISAVSLFIQMHGDEAAERYHDHEIVESYKGALQYERCRARLGQKAISTKTLSKLKSAYDDCLAKYGEVFDKPQGWAAKYFNERNPSIADIQQAGGIDHLGPYYKMASHNVHANPKGIFFKLGLIGESDVLLSGPSNAGMADPGHATAISLLQVAASLMEFEPTLDSQVLIRVMTDLADEIGEALLVAHRKLERNAREFDDRAGGPGRSR